MSVTVQVGEGGGSHCPCVGCSHPAHPGPTVAGDGGAARSCCLSCFPQCPQCAFTQGLHTGIQKPPGNNSKHQEANSRGVCLFLCHNLEILYQILPWNLRIGAKVCPHQIPSFQILHIPNLPPGCPGLAPGCPGLALVSPGLPPVCPGLAPWVPGLAPPPPGSSAWHQRSCMPLPNRVHSLVASFQAPDRRYLVGRKVRMACN